MDTEQSIDSGSKEAQFICGRCEVSLYTREFFLTRAFARCVFCRVEDFSPETEYVIFYGGGLNRKKQQTLFSLPQM